jgi:L-ascorbate metabolism protein UlaG (beta-lactamase superfamily)
MSQTFKNSNPNIIIGNFPWYEMLWRSMRGDFQPKHEPQQGYAYFEKQWTQPVDFELIAKQHQQPLITWLGHVSMLLQVANKNFLIDPTLAKHAGPFGKLGAKRMVKAPLQAHQLPKIDYVLISHNHYDHLCWATIKALLKSGQNPHFIVPIGLAAWFTQRGIQQVTELNWLESIDLNSELKVYFTPAQHWSRRHIFDTNKTLWGGFIIERTYSNQLELAQPSEHKTKPWRFYFPGDTGYSNDFNHIRQKIGPIDFIALPIGAYLPRDFMKNMHVNPSDAVQLMKDTGAKQALGVHWGTFQLTQESFDQPPLDLAQALKEQNLPSESVWLLKHGESRLISD